MSVLEASSLITLMSGTSVISRLVTPMLCEKYGTKFVMGWFYFLQGIPVIMLFGASDSMMFYGFALFFGVGLGGESAGFPILMRQYYGFAPSAAPHGTQMLGAGLGRALGGWVGGIVYDIYGNMVNQIFSDYKSSGNHSITWNPETLSSGIYFVSITQNQISKKIKVMYTK